MTRFFSVVCVAMISGCDLELDLDDFKPDTDTETETDETTTDPEPTVPAVETECDDEIDDDGDGLFDCDDGDCNAVEHCSWPQGLGFQSRIEYEASTLAQLGGFDDCTLLVESILERDRDDACDGCDWVFTGALGFPQDDCPEEFVRPTDGTYGINFSNDPQSWLVFGLIEGAWIEVGNFQNDGTGTMLFQNTAEIIVEGIDGGDLVTNFEFTRL